MENKINEKAGKRILILCTGNSCRSQMAEGFLKSFDPSLQVFSAGTNPSASIHPKAVTVMQEKGIDLSAKKPKNVSLFLQQSFDFVITVCDHARESCPLFLGSVGEQLHMGFEDPAAAQGTEEHILDVFRRIRDEIEKVFKQFYEEKIK